MSRVTHSEPGLPMIGQRHVFALISRILLLEVPRPQCVQRLRMKNSCWDLNLRPLALTVRWILSLRREKLKETNYSHQSLAESIGSDSLMYSNHFPVARVDVVLLWWMKLLKLRPYTEGFETTQAAVRHQQFQGFCFFVLYRFSRHLFLFISPVPMFQGRSQHFCIEWSYCGITDPIEMTTECLLLGGQGACFPGKLRFSRFSEKDFFLFWTQISNYLSDAKRN